MKRVAVIGAGPAGLMAAAFAAKGGNAVDLFESNEKVGKKLFLTGKGRCNITNSASLDGFMASIPHNSRFLYSAFNKFFNSDLISILSEQGVKVKLERGGRYFPASDKSSDVIRALSMHAKSNGVRFVLNSCVKSITKHDEGFKLVVQPIEVFSSRSVGNQGTISKQTENQGRLSKAATQAYDAVIIATGGASYASTGSSGDGYAFATAFGHTVFNPKPALTALETKESWAHDLMGLTLKNVALKAYPPSSKKAKPKYEELGEMLFTHFGVSGPLVLSASSFLADDIAGARLEIDLKPALSFETLDARLLRDFEKHKHKQLKNAMVELLSQRLIPVVLMLAGINEDIDPCNLTRIERYAIVSTLKQLSLTVSKARPIDEAIITRGGVSVKEINASTMESKLVSGLFFAGEVIDVDACTGGFNLQIACSTGAVAGMSL